jgi:hypothetical protein
MPKTFTDDVGLALPSAVKGPLTVVDPNDATSFFKIDPALGRVQASGAARPRRRICAGVTRVSGVASTVTMDSALDARSVAASSDGGFFVFPFQLPADLDPAAPSDVFVALSPSADGGGGGVVRLELLAAHAKDGDTSLTTETVTYDWTTPSSWTTQDLKTVRVDAGAGYTFAGGTFEAGEVVGLLIRRLGAAAQDTFSQGLVMAACLIFEYAAKEV